MIKCDIHNHLLISNVRFFPLIHLFVVVKNCIMWNLFYFFTVILQFGMLQETLVLFQKNVTTQTTCTSILMSKFTETIFELTIPRFMFFCFFFLTRMNTRLRGIVCSDLLMFNNIAVAQLTKHFSNRLNNKTVLKVTCDLWPLYSTHHC